MKIRGAALAIGIVAIAVGSIIIALIINPAQAGEQAQAIGTSGSAETQIPTDQVLLDIAAELGWANVYTEALHNTTQIQLNIAQKLTELADELAARGDIKGAAEHALIATEIEQRVALKFKAAAGITETYTRALTQQRGVTQELGSLFEFNYDSTKSESGPTPLFRKNFNSSKSNTSGVGIAPLATQIPTQKNFNSSKSNTSGVIKIDPDSDGIQNQTRDFNDKKTTPVPVN